MQIQRIQTVYIFLAFLMMAVYLFVPFGTVAEADSVVGLCPTGEYSLLIPVALTALLLVVDIFLYKNPSSQLRVLSISTIITVCSLVVAGCVIYKSAADFTAWNVLPLVAFILEIRAVAAIKHDIKLLNSYNRLR